ncbi:hypothetical protein DAPPUDRAFT_114291 [Daphnia pulex]|uniref:Uncharacterized protein n=1 Tax=Daphnia pulex TaxID=6669 RepID=E9HHP6_DAPPU|nr:hypothetical protein DAPPUDRAFT_114291 [Daphnia pulex]|eukprot:EFX68742.1 hypothetical protein DAPPUDRAFT_114291 [Daphnia pulex]
MKMRWITKKRRLPQNHLWSPMKILMLRLLLNPLHPLSLSELSKKKAAASKDVDVESRKVPVLLSPIAQKPYKGKALVRPRSATKLHSLAVIESLPSMANIPVTVVGVVDNELPGELLVSKVKYNSHSSGSLKKISHCLTKVNCKRLNYLDKFPLSVTAATTLVIEASSKFSFIWSSSLWLSLLLAILCTSCCWAATFPVKVDISSVSMPP